MQGTKGPPKTPAGTTVTSVTCCDVLMDVKAQAPSGGRSSVPACLDACARLATHIGTLPLDASHMHYVQEHTMHVRLIDAGQGEGPPESETDANSLQGLLPASTLANSDQKSPSEPSPNLQM